MTSFLGLFTLIAVLETDWAAISRKLHVSATETKRWHHSRSWMLTSAPFSRSQWSTLCAPYNAAWISHSAKYKMYYHHYQFIQPVSLPVMCQLSTEYFLTSNCHSCHSFEFMLFETLSKWIWFKNFLHYQQTITKYFWERQTSKLI